MTTFDTDRRRLQLVVLGRQGAGKGVQCARLARRHGIDHISTGDLLRQAVADATPLGRAVERFLVAGALVPDEVVVSVVAGAIEQATARGRGTVLDGYPRTVAQMTRLDALLPAGRIDLAIHIDVPRSIVLERLSARGRADDRGEAIGRRLSEHASNIGPLIQWLDQRGLLVEVDGVGTPDVVASRMAAAVDACVPALTAGAA